MRTHELNMKIIEPSATIIEDDLAALTVHQRIDTAASVCYQRPPKPTEEEAVDFCRKMIKSGHGATLEMAVIHLVTDPANVVESKYILASQDDHGKIIMSGSIRAFREADGEYGSRVWNFLAQEFPLFFYESDVPRYNDVRFANDDEIPDSHRHVAVKFIINRAVSHELVRHRPCSFLQESQRFCRYGDEVTFIRPLWCNHNSQPDLWTIFETDCRESEARYQSLLEMHRTPQQARSVLPNSTKTELIVYTNLGEWKHIFSLRDSKAADPEMVRVMRPLHEEFRRRWPEFFGYSEKYPNGLETEQ